MSSRIGVPTKPFDSYAWHWASVQPTENLNIPPVYFGVLRALRSCEGKLKSSSELFDALKKVEDELRGRGSIPEELRLAREPSRNLLRNSGQYWQALGLFDARPQAITLTDLGRRVADRSVSIDDFIAATVRSLVLPNENVSDAQELALWSEAKLRIYPLRLLLEICATLFDESGEDEAYLTIEELTRLIIPLAAASQDASTHFAAIMKFRAGQLDISGWPDCTPGANDQRSASEFLLFLANNGFLELEKRNSSRKATWRFWLRAYAVEAVTGVLQRVPDGSTIESAIAASQEDGVSELVTRTRRTIEQLVRPGQASFRREVFRKHGARCLLTSETTQEALVAAHILHAKWGGPEEWQNGIPLRTDIHVLWDQGLVTLLPTGEVRRSSRLDGSPTYSKLPDRFDVPAGTRANLEWRVNYQ